MVVVGVVGVVAATASLKCRFVDVVNLLRRDGGVSAEMLGSDLGRLLVVVVFPADSVLNAELNGVCLEASLWTLKPIRFDVVEAANRKNLVLRWMRRRLRFIW